MIYLIKKKKQHKSVILKQDRINNISSHKANVKSFKKIVQNTSETRFWI